MSCGAPRLTVCGEHVAVDPEQPPGGAAKPAWLRLTCASEFSVLRTSHPEDISRRSSLAVLPFVPRYALYFDGYWSHPAIPIPQHVGDFRGVSYSSRPNVFGMSYDEKLQE